MFFECITRAIKPLIKYFIRKEYFVSLVAKKYKRNILSQLTRPFIFIMSQFACNRKITKTIIKKTPRQGQGTFLKIDYLDMASINSNTITLPLGLSYLLKKIHSFSSKKLNSGSSSIDYEVTVQFEKCKCKRLGLLDYVSRPSLFQVLFWNHVSRH